MNDAIQQKLKALGLAYAAELPTKIQEIEQAWRDVRDHQNQEQLKELIRYAHMLSGTAGTYGYQLVTDVSRKLEQDCREIESAGMNPTLVTEIENLIEDLKQLVLKPPEIAQEQDLIPLELKGPLEQHSIYILEENKNELMNTLEPIKQMNYSIHVFNDVSTFLIAVEQKHPDMLLLEIKLARQIPVETLKRFRDQFSLIVFISHQDDLAGRLFTVRHGGQAFLVKPIETSALIHSIDNLFEARQIANERIMIVDDSEFLVDYYATILEHAGMEIKKVSQLDEFLIQLKEFQPDLILMDVNMPFCTGIELAQIIQQQESFSDIPIIFLSNIAQKSKQLKALSLAGDDFLTKPIDPNYLLAAVRNRLVRSRILRSRILRDSLTNLYNHSMIHYQLERELSIAQRNQTQLSIALLDIDHFKEVNDTFGHQTGDKVLKNFSIFLHNNLREHDLVGRYGGEEFLIVMPNTSPQVARLLLDELRVKFAVLSQSLGDRPLPISFSAGIASYPIEQLTTLLVKKADEALYKAKRLGRNRVVSAIESAIENK